MGGATRLPPARQRSRLPMLLTAAAVVLALAATALIIVLTNQSTGTAQVIRTPAP